METFHLHNRTIAIHCAPCKNPCPTCCKLGRRKQVLHQRVRSIEYRRVVILDITYAEYRARCRCRTCFRTSERTRARTNAKTTVAGSEG